MMAPVPVMRWSPRMGEEDFALWASLLERCTGIQWSGAQRSFLETRLRMRMREVGLDTFRGYYDHVLAQEPGCGEWSVLLDRLTIHESRFFRHRPSFDLIRVHYLGLLDCVQAPLRLRAWSVGCATGEEPYTLAMVIDDTLRHLGCPYEFHVIGMDISSGALAAARFGEYARSKMRDVPTGMRGRYFAAGRETSRVAETLRKRVVFLQANVLEERCHFAQEMDLVMCQNLLIYFSAPAQARILSMLVESLAPGGLLVLGPGEVVRWSHSDLRRVNAPNTLAFRKVEGARHAGEGSHG
jgi:type IV pilus assembly protein PilK